MSDPRPTDCRFRLQDEGKAYPRSSCTACGKGIMTGLGRSCSAVPMRRRFNVHLTKREAKIVWGLLDGALDAGACAGGLTEEETKAAQRVADGLLHFSRSRRQPGDEL